jgi:hypothetical protein
MARLIPLTKGQWAVVDDNLYSYLSQWKWFAQKQTKGDYYYAVTQIRNPFKPKRANGSCAYTTVSMHQFILGVHGRDNIVDHADCDTLNNQIQNLRPCDRSQNAANRGPTRANTSGIKGISKNGNKWVAATRLHGKRVYIGRFDSPEEAHAAYAKVTKEHYGEFSRTQNNPEILIRNPKLALYESGQ